MYTCKWTHTIITTQTRSNTQSNAQTHTNIEKKSVYFYIYFYLILKLKCFMFIFFRIFYHMKFTFVTVYFIVYALEHKTRYRQIFYWETALKIEMYALSFIAIQHHFTKIILYFCGKKKQHEKENTRYVEICILLTFMQRLVANAFVFVKNNVSKLYTNRYATKQDEHIHW